MANPVSHRATTVWNLVFNYGATALTFVSGVVLVPMYLSHIPVAVYGYWLASGNILAWVTSVDPGFASIIQQRIGFHQGAGDRRQTGRFISASLILSLAMVLVILAVGGAVWLGLDRLLDPTQVEQWGAIRESFGLAVMGTAMMIASYGITSVNLGLMSSIGPGLIYIGCFSAALVFTVFGLRSGLGVQTLAWAMIVRGGGMLVLGLAFMFWRMRQLGVAIQPDMRAVPEVLKLGGYSFLGRAPAVIGANLESFVAAKFIGAEAAPVLSMTRKVMDVLRLVAERPAVALMPSVSHLAGAGDLDRLGAAVGRLFRFSFWVLGLIFAGFISLNASFVTLWVGAEFYAGDLANLILCAGTVTTTLVLSLSNLCYAIGNIRGNSIVSLVLGVVSTGLLFAGAPILGLIGICLAPLLANIFVGLVYYPAKLRSLVQLPGREWSLMLSEAGRVAIVAASLGALFRWLHPESWLTFVLSAIGVATAYAFVLMLLSSALRAELQRIPVVSRLFRRVFR